jgi:L-alanine-DL-glutamate epimerase-like enolase superfamily enzyme
VGGTAIVALVDDYCARMLVGEDPLAIGRLWEALGKQLRRSGTGLAQLALAAVDTALWDLAGKHTGLPVHRLLGGCRDSVPAYGSGIDLFLDEQGLLAHVEELLALGFDWIKIKVGKDDPAEDAARAVAVRRLIGPQRRLCVDANQVWELPAALRHAAALAGAGADLVWLEEPLHPEDVAGHASLRARVALPVAIGESIYSDSQFLAYLRAGAVDVLQPDICRVGGFTGFVRIANLAAAHHLPIAPHYLAELTLPALCAIPNGLVLEWVRGGTLGELGVLAEPMRLEDGVAHASQAPGHGVVLDREALAPYEVDVESLRLLDTSAAK